jgi:flagella basal body P-ring formation protein FlgA
MALQGVPAFLVAQRADISANSAGIPVQFRAWGRPPVVTLQGVNILYSVCCLPIVATALPAAAQAVPASALAEAQALVAQAAQALAPAGARVEVVAGALDSRLRLSPCERVEAFLPAGTRAWGASRVGLRCAQGQRPWSVSLPVTVRVLAPAPVVPAALPAGAVVDATAWARAEVNYAADPSPVQPRADSLNGRVLLRAVAAGQPLRAADLRPRQWFAAGDTVRIVAVGSGFAVSGEGQALSAGIEGQTARVRTESGRVLSGQPSGEHRLEVAL